MGCATFCCRQWCGCLPLHRGGTCLCRASHALSVQGLAVQQQLSHAAAGTGLGVSSGIDMADVSHAAAGNGLGVSLGTGLAMAPSVSSPLRLARYTVLSLAADFNSSSLPGQAVTLLQDSQETNTPLEPDTRLLVYRLAIAGGGSTIWNNLKQLYVQVTSTLRMGR